MEQLIIVYLVVINLVALALMYIDKQKAKNHKWRISENTLIGVSAIGGSIGALWGMHAFRHKTKHVKFTIGIPLILVLQTLLTLYILR